MGGGGAGAAGVGRQGSEGGSESGRVAAFARHLEAAEHAYADVHYSLAAAHLYQAVACCATCNAKVGLRPDVAAGVLRNNLQYVSELIDRRFMRAALFPAVAAHLRTTAAAARPRSVRVCARGAAHGERRLRELERGKRRRNRMRALNRAETRLYDSERAFATLQGDAEQQLEFYASTIAKREAQIAASKQALTAIERGVPAIRNQMHHLKMLVDTSSTIFTTGQKTHREFVKLRNKIGHIAHQVEGVEQDLLESSCDVLGAEIAVTPSPPLTGDGQLLF